MCRDGHTNGGRRDDELVNDDLPPEPHPFDDYAVLIDVIRAHLDAIGGFIDTYSNIDVVDPSPEERGRLVAVEGLLNQALDQFS